MLLSAAVFTAAWKCTVKLLDFGTPKNLTVIYLKIQTKRPNLSVFCQNDTNGIANSEDPDQIAPVDPDVSARNVRVITVAAWKWICSFMT